MPQNQPPENQEQVQDQLIDDELDEPSLDEVSGGLSTALDSAGNTVSPSSSLSGLNKQAVKSFQCNYTDKGTLG